jgi:hypothetical protein
MSYGLHYPLWLLHKRFPFVFLFLISFHAFLSTSFLAKLSRDYHLHLFRYEPTPEALDPNASFSACLLVKDDNDILSEWIAYHYHVLRLRRLIVAVDPTSADSPNEILERYRRLTDIEIIQWEDEDYLNPDFLRKHQPVEPFLRRGAADTYLSPEKMRQVANHRYRQSAFFASCMKEMKVRGSSYVIHVDTDEFVTTENPFAEAKEGDSHEESASTEDSVLMKVQKHIQESGRDYPCYSVFRVPYSSLESADNEINALVPRNFDAKQFETLRWRHHSSPEKMMLVEHYPKVIVDVSVLPAERLSRETVSSIHRPFWDICEHIQQPAEHPELYREQAIVINHYVGSWERYGSKKDDRRNQATYESRASANEGAYDGIRPWLQDFTDAMGVARATALLGSRYQR